jgi:hypothetical protein
MTSPPKYTSVAAGGWELFPLFFCAMALKMRASGPLNKEFPQYQQVSKSLSMLDGSWGPHHHIWLSVVLFVWLCALKEKRVNTSKLFVPCVT